MLKTTKNLKITVVLAMLAAISIICGKYLALNAGEVMRFSLESMPIIFAGVVFGPVAGIMVGAVADIVGCLMVAYPINPSVTIGAACIGLVSGVMPMIFKKFNLKSHTLLIISVAAAHLIGSVVIKTIGLSAYFEMPFFVLMAWRMLNYIIVGALDGSVIYVILKNKGVQMQIKSLGGEEK